MARIIIFIVLCCYFQASIAVTYTPTTDRNIICSLKYGDYENNLYRGITPMETACSTERYDLRKRICEQNYQKSELVQACIDTYDSATAAGASRAEENLPTHTGQEVGGLVINYSPLFNKNTASTNNLASKFPENVRQAIVSLDVFSAPPSNGLGEVNLVRILYVPELNGSIDGAATESVKRIAALDGIKNLQQQINSLFVSGFDARQVSISADRWGGKLGVELLIIYNKKTNVIWQLQLIFGKKKEINPFSSLNTDKERRYAKTLLSTVRILP